MTYFFILGKNPKLSIAEIRADIKDGDFNFAEEPFDSAQGNALFLHDAKIDIKNLMKRLGGTVKIGEVVGKIKDLDELKDLIIKEIPRKESKIYFGISNYANYSARDVKRAAMEIKKSLKESKKPVRWVTSKEKILSSVIVKTNKLLTHGVEICLFKNGFVGKTLAVQEFEEFEKRDYGKPARDILRGMIPPKLARIMINLSEADKSATILDPFCGTGTILVEAIAMGYKNLIGSDGDARAIEQSKKNIEWVKEEQGNALFLQNLNIKLLQSKSEEISKKLSPKSIDTIITEPYLGPLLKGSESKEKIKKIIKELSELYLKSFKDWKKILKKDAKVIMIFPVFKIGGTDIREDLKKLGYKKLNQEDLIYERPGQKVKRGVDIFEKI